MHDAGRVAIKDKEVSRSSEPLTLTSKKTRTLTVYLLFSKLFNKLHVFKEFSSISDVLQVV